MRGNERGGVGEKRPKGGGGTGRGGLWGAGANAEKRQDFLFVSVRTKHIPDKQNPPISEVPTVGHPIPRGEHEGKPASRLADAKRKVSD